MLRVGRASAIAEKNQFTSPGERFAARTAIFRREAAILRRNSVSRGSFH